MHTWAFEYGYAGAPACGCLIKRNLSRVVSKACRQPEGSVFRNGPFAEGVNLPEYGGNLNWNQGSLIQNPLFNTMPQCMNPCTLLCYYHFLKSR